jgi:hypothetical protein
VTWSPKATARAGDHGHAPMLAMLAMLAMLVGVSPGVHATFVPSSTEIVQPSPVQARCKPGARPVVGSAGRHRSTSTGLLKGDAAPAVTGQASQPFPTLDARQGRENLGA